jgi:hypothetical protein
MLPGPTPVMLAHPTQWWSRQWSAAARLQPWLWRSVERRVATTVLAVPGTADVLPDMAVELNLVLWVTKA